MAWSCYDLTKCSAIKCPLISCILILFHHQKHSTLWIPAWMYLKESSSIVCYIEPQNISILILCQPCLCIPHFHEGVIIYPCHNLSAALGNLRFGVRCILVYGHYMFWVHVLSRRKRYPNGVRRRWRHRWQFREHLLELKHLHGHLMLMVVLLMKCRCMFISQPVQTPLRRLTWDRVKPRICEKVSLYRTVLNKNLMTILRKKHVWFDTGTTRFAYFAVIWTKISQVERRLLVSFC